MTTHQYNVQELISITQVAEILHRTRTQINRLIVEDRLVTQRLGPHAKMITRASLVAELRRRGMTVELRGDELGIIDAEDKRKSA